MATVRLADKTVTWQEIQLNTGSFLAVHEMQWNKRYNRGREREMMCVIGMLSIAAISRSHDPFYKFIIAMPCKTTTAGGNVSICRWHELKICAVYSCPSMVVRFKRQ
ncbi:unnamed protein product [Scytosiphon promiscuus]